MGLRTAINNGDTGLVARTAINNNFINSNIKVYNVEDYGAVHDGVTDDTEAIQDAINACFDAGGGIVYFPNGVYIIDGPLKNGIGEAGIDYNSQLYIPGTAIDDRGPKIILLGESVSFYHHSDFDPSGVVLYSRNSENTGLYPSVICNIYIWGIHGYFSYTEVDMYNIHIVVSANEDANGPTMCGVNFLNSGRAFLDHVFVSTDVAMEDTVEPVNNRFGIGLGEQNDDFPSFGRIVVMGGFYKGYVLGEGVHGMTLESYGNLFGLWCLGASFGVCINYAIMHWNKYTLAPKARTTLIIEYLSTQVDSMRAVWSYNQDMFADNSNYFYGYVNYILSSDAGLGVYQTKTHGGLNILIKNIYKDSYYHWETTTRPADPGLGCLGFNTTTSKMECWDGGAWRDLH